MERMLLWWRQGSYFAKTQTFTSINLYCNILLQNQSLIFKYCWCFLVIHFWKRSVFFIIFFYKSKGGPKVLTCTHTHSHTIYLITVRRKPGTSHNQTRPANAHTVKISWRSDKQQCSKKTHYITFNITFDITTPLKVFF